VRRAVVVVDMGVAGDLGGLAAAGKIVSKRIAAGALIAHALCPTATEYVIAAHRSAEVGHTLMQEHLGKKPLLDLALRLGEGTGAALAMNLVEAAVRVLTEVATFDEASVSKADK
jgi:nicotinate-nucleotide--dimethylbenzimidazole phosphoribosyltransferase